jgi:hypothetical protein
VIGVKVFDVHAFRNKVKRSFSRGHPVVFTVH